MCGIADFLYQSKDALNKSSQSTKKMLKKSYRKQPVAFLWRGITANCHWDVKWLFNFHSQISWVLESWLVPTMLMQFTQLRAGSYGLLKTSNINPKKKDWIETKRSIIKGRRMKSDVKCEERKDVSDVQKWKSNDNLSSGLSLYQKNITA